LVKNWNFVQKSEFQSKIEILVNHDKCTNFISIIKIFLKFCSKSNFFRNFVKNRNFIKNWNFIKNRNFVKKTIFLVKNWIKVKNWFKVSSKKYWNYGNFVKINIPPFSSKFGQILSKFPFCMFNPKLRPKKREFTNFTVILNLNNNIQIVLIWKSLGNTLIKTVNTIASTWIRSWKITKVKKRKKNENSAEIFEEKITDNHGFYDNIFTQEKYNKIW